ncbi:short-chain dehydrogenase [Paenibacillus sp. SSG-1]|uniref:SDR family oxidoreductase n=1 Tax=unclassified Paenibacillus TaxID=185978 RepID=UPI000B7D17AE|nr:MULTISPECIES: SDR family oxidoreductase [unclassified Paenibacillus]OXL82468.1 short-chain dehydrogenase [Paenibacillus sp. SSG-1]UYO03955.1 SDR family oxidoreductase [Paenibacillus sp. PSB04]
MTKPNLEGKIALITGATRGIGLETARGLARLGATVILGSRDIRKGNEAAYQLHQEGLKAVSIQIDVTDQQDHAAVYQYLEETYGKLDILVNNAGVLLEQSSISAATQNQTSAIPLKELRDTFDVNFFAQVELTQTLLPLIRKSEAGRIVNVSSILGSLTLQADPGSPIYSIKTFGYNASKAALNAFTIHLAHELKDTSIKVNSVHPGWVRTQLGGEHADLDEAGGSETSVLLASLQEDGPTGGFFHLNDSLPW